MATTRQLGKLEVNLEQFSANNYVLERLGKGANAAVFATVSKAAVTKMTTEANNLNSRDQEVTAINLLLPELKATKVFDNYDQDSFVREVSITQRVARHGNSSIVQLHRDSRWNNGAAAFNDEYWYDLELLAGGTLEGLSKCVSTVKQQLPMEFCWHMAGQLFSALLDVHFDGVRNHKSRFKHGDIKKGNVLLRPSADDSIAYPDVVLADFGNAEELLAPPARNAAARAALDRQKREFWKQQQTDAQSMALQLVHFCGNRDRVLNGLLREFTDLKVNAQTAAGRAARYNNHLKRAMRDIVNGAATYRAQQAFVPLSAEIREHINRQCVSDEALEAVMKDQVDEKAAREHARRNSAKAFKPKKPRRTSRETTPESRASASPKPKTVGRRLAPRTAAPNTAHRPQPPPRRKGK